jgi:hypothetical protein
MGGWLAGWLEAIVWHVRFAILSSALRRGDSVCPAGGGSDRGVIAVVAAFRSEVVNER